MDSWPAVGRKRERARQDSWRRTRENAAHALGQLQGLCRHWNCAGIAPEGCEDVQVWGQYLDVRKKAPAESWPKQFGIYGSAAAIQILGIREAKSSEFEIYNGLCALPTIGEGCKRSAWVRERYEQKGDLRVVYKVAALIDAAAAADAARANAPNATPPSLGSALDQLAEHLVELKLPGALGWPDSETDARQSPSVHATAVALYSLSLLKLPDSGRRRDSVREAVSWLGNEDVERLGTATLAIMALAMRRLLDYGPGEEGWVVLYERCIKALRLWIYAARPEYARSAVEAVDYCGVSRGPGTSARFAPQSQFLIYIPHCVVAVAIESLPELHDDHRCRVFLQETIGCMASGVEGDPKSATTGREMVSTVESLWYSRAFAGFVEFDESRKARRKVGDWIRRPTVKTVGVVIACNLLVGLVALCSGGNQSVWLTIAPIAASSVASFFIGLWLAPGAGSR